MKPGELISLIERLDLGLVGPDEDFTQPYLELRQWVGSDNDIDTSATQLVRRLAREKLGSFALDEVGAAVLAKIDERAA